MFKAKFSIILALLALIAFIFPIQPRIAEASRANALPQTNTPAPVDIGLNVKTQFGAVGDGIADDTNAIKAALAFNRSDPDLDYYGRPSLLFFPAGTYLVSDTLAWIGCCMTLQGEGTASTVIKLKNSAAGYGDATNPKAVIFTPNGNMSFRQNIFDLTVNTGTGNPGAIGLDYISNNWGAIRGVNVISADNNAKTGISMMRSWPGPLLVRDTGVKGFSVGIDIQHGEYGPVFENIILEGQSVAGIRNHNNTITIRKLQSTNTVPALINTEWSGSAIVLDSTLNGGSGSRSALENTGDLFVRNVTASGYASAIKTGTTVVPGLSVGEYIARPLFAEFPTPPRTLNLPIAEVPTFYEPIANWHKATPSGTSSGASLTALQNAFNSGKSTIYFSYGGSLWGNANLLIPPTVRRMVSFGHVLNNWDGVGLVLRVEDNSTTPLIIEGFGYGLTIEHRGSRPLVLKHGGYNYKEFPGAGDVHLDDVGLSPVTFSEPHRIWARQLNTEGNSTRIVNDGAQLWILGIKTEGNGTIIETKGGGKTELFGTLIYPAQSVPIGRPAFINTESSVSLIYSWSSYVTNGMFSILMRETRGGVTRELARSSVSGRTMPLYVGYRALRPDTPGVYNAGTWHLRNSNTTGGADQTVTFGGAANHLPVVGDWNGDGIDSVGVYDTGTGVFLLSNSNTSPTVNYSVVLGNPGDTPFSGKWASTMAGDGAGVYRNSNGILYAKRDLTSGFADYFMIFGNPGDIGFAGDWDNDGFDSVGIYRASGTRWFLSNCSTCAGITFSDLDLVWSIGSGKPVSGDWDGDGISTVASFSGGLFSVRSANTAAGTLNQFSFGPAAGKPVAGKWIAPSAPPPIMNAISGVLVPSGGAGNSVQEYGSAD